MTLHGGVFRVCWLNLEGGNLKGLERLVVPPVEPEISFRTIAGNPLEHAK